MTAKAVEEKIMDKINYDQWAEHLLEEIYYTPDHQRVALIKSHLEMAHQCGYREGDEKGWSDSQEKEYSMQKERDKNYWVSRVVEYTNDKALAEKCNLKVSEICNHELSSDIRICSKCGELL